MYFNKTAAAAIALFTGVSIAADHADARSSVVLRSDSPGQSAAQLQNFQAAGGVISTRAGEQVEVTFSNGTTVVMGPNARLQAGTDGSGLRLLRGAFRVSTAGGQSASIAAGGTAVRISRASVSIVVSERTTVVLNAGGQATVSSGGGETTLRRAGFLTQTGENGRPGRARPASGSVLAQVRGMMEPGAGIRTVAIGPDAPSDTGGGDRAPAPQAPQIVAGLAAPENPVDEQMVLALRLASSTPGGLPAQDVDGGLGGGTGAGGAPGTVTVIPASFTAPQGSIIQTWTQPTTTVSMEARVPAGVDGVSGKPVPETRTFVINGASKRYIVFTSEQVEGSVDPDDPDIDTIEKVRQVAIDSGSRAVESTVTIGGVLYEDVPVFRWTDGNIYVQLESGFLLLNEQNVAPDLNGTVEALSGRSAGQARLEFAASTVPVSLRTKSLSVTPVADGVQVTLTFAEPLAGAGDLTLDFKGTADDANTDSFLALLIGTPATTGNAQITSGDLLPAGAYQPSSVPVSVPQYSYLDWGVLSGSVPYAGGTLVLPPTGWVAGKDVASPQDVAQFAGTASYSGHSFGTATDAAGTRSVLGTYSNDWDFGAREGTFTLGFDGATFTGTTGISADNSGFTSSFATSTRSGALGGTFFMGGADPTQPGALGGEFSIQGVVSSPYSATGIVAAEKQ